MIFNYIHLGWRNLTANKTVSFINIFGLSIAVACSITVFLFLRNYWTLDNFHANGERIFMVEYQTEMDGQTQTWGDAPAPIARVLRTDFPQVEHCVRTSREGVIVARGEHTFEEILTYADTGYFQVFSFPLHLGNPAALTDPDAVILSADIAKKYFMDEIPLGKSITLTKRNREKKTYTVQGVAAPFPNNASLRFDLLTGHDPALLAKEEENWACKGDGVFVLLRQAADAPALAAQLTQYLPMFNARNQERPAKAFTLDNLKYPSAQAYEVNQRPAEAHHPVLSIIFSSIALLLLALSCFNYVNISLGAVTRRLKEIGIRKVMGSSRSALIGQFMTENLLLCSLSLGLGLIFCQVIFAPMLNNLMVMQIGLSLTQNIDLWLFLVGLLVFTGLASGAYPALYVSGFRPTVIFAGKQKFGGKNTFRQVLLTMQFALAFVAVIFGVVLLTAGQHWSTMAWGYNPSQTWVVQLSDTTQFSLLKNELLKNPNVESISGAGLHVGLNSDQEEIKIGEVTTEARRFNVGAGYAEALGLQIQTGRFFEENRRIEDENSVMVNETFAKKQNWRDALGQQIKVGDKNYRIVGVLKDFKMFGTGAMQPAVFFCTAEQDFGFLVARFSPGSGKQVEAQAKQAFQQLFGSVPLNQFFQTEVFDGFNRIFWNLARSFGYIAALALFIACLGLYGLATQHFARRMKEVSVRKLLGASVRQVMLLVNREFIFMLLLAGAISTGLCFTGFQLIFNKMERFVGSYRPGATPFLLANLLVLATAALAIGRQSWQLARVKLAESLKNNE